MAIFAGILPSRISFHCQSRLISICIPWLNRTTTIRCLKSRDHSSSSVPVRYIPKQSSKINDELEQSPLPLKDSQKRVLDKSLGKTSTMAEKGRNQKHTYNKQTFLFDVSQQAFSGLEEEIDNDVEMIQHNFVEEPKGFTEIRIRPERETCKKDVLAARTLVDAEKMAIECLATRSFTAMELRKKLSGKRFSSDIVESLIVNFRSRGLINDTLYAETFSRSRWSSLSWGPRRIKQALFKKGVSNADAEKAIKLVFEDDESRGQESRHGMSKLSMERLIVQASKQWLRGEDVPKETRKSRIIRWLQYRGFNWDVISFILKMLESKSSS